MDKRYFSKKVVEWYQQNKRELPWRETTDPYRIWLSEIILQQTRVIQGLPYYNRFVETYPTIDRLAAAPLSKVLRLWQGLGYYTRARNLHKCAREVARHRKGKFPATFDELRQLPGIGDYTAAAIASIAFGEPVAVVDGNVYRVLSRIFGIETPINTPGGKKEFSAVAASLVPTHEPDKHNQAMMEFGATLCTPQNPRCDQCIFKSSCVAFRNETQQSLPVKLRGKQPRKRFFHYLVFKTGNAVFMKKRTMKDIWHGLFDFPLIETERALSKRRLLELIDEKTKSLQTVEVITDDYKHVLTHQVIHCKFIVIDAGKNASGKVHFDAQPYAPRKITALPKPVLISRFLEDYQFYS